MEINLSELIKSNQKQRQPLKSVVELEKKRIQEIFNSCGYLRVNTKLYDTLLNYAVKVSTGTAKAGLTLIGSIGCGKTSGVEILAGIFRDSMDFISAPDLTIAYDEKSKYEKLRAPINFWGKHKHLVIDDIGTEPCPYNSYGTEINVIADVLAERYRLWSRYGVLTIMTTNLPKDQFLKLYGERSESRNEQMNNIVSVNGEDLRKRFR